jgi:predicted RNA-binding Zn-ribbon protein involved in translation (DUF1610 family)
MMCACLGVCGLTVKVVRGANFLQCPDCGDLLDVWPKGAKFGYCYTCHKVVRVEEVKA